MCFQQGKKLHFTFSYAVSRICLSDNNMKNIKAKLAKPELTFTMK